MEDKLKKQRVKASIKYNAKNVKQIKINLNKKTDADIIEYLDKADNVQGLIKDLIRKDMTTFSGGLFNCQKRFTFDRSVYNINVH